MIVHGADLPHTPPSAPPWRRKHRSVLAIIIEDMTVFSTIETRNGISLCGMMLTCILDLVLKIKNVPVAPKFNLTSAMCTEPIRTL